MSLLEKFQLYQELIDLLPGFYQEFLVQPGRCKALNSWFRFLVRFWLLVCQVFELPGKFRFLVFENLTLPGSR